MKPVYHLTTQAGMCRNNGLGDYFELFDGSWQVVSTEMPDSLHTDLILLHELVETMLIRQAGIPESDITAFDAQFEILRESGLAGVLDEPGDSPQAPYYKQHQIASKIEKLMCEEGYNLNWSDYEASCNNHC